MVLLMYRDLLFCQCLFSRETRKLTFWTSCSSVMPALQGDSPKFKTFFIGNLRSLTYPSMLSPWVSRAGSLPALFGSGPNRRGICFISNLEARKASYSLANSLTGILALFKFLRSSALMNAYRLGLIAVLLVAEDPDADFRVVNVAKLDSAGETLVLLEATVLEANLKVDSLE